MSRLASVRPHTRYVLAIAVVGLLAAGFAIVFRLALHGALHALFGDADTLRAFRALPRVWRLAAPAAGGALAGLIVALTARRATGGHGVADVMEAVVLGRGRLSIAATLSKALGSFAAIVGGGSIGREGPLIQFGAAAGDVIGRALALPARRTRALVAAGVAAGFAAAYNTPIAAVLFVTEVVTGVIALDVVLPVVVATTIGTAVTRLAIGGGPIYGLRAFALTSNLEFVAYAALGVLAGLLGPAFMATLDAGERLAARLAWPRVVRGAAGGLLVGALAALAPEVAGNGYEAIRGMLEGHYAALVLLALLAAKVVATASSVGSGSPGGVFTPTLFLGAALGGALGARIDVLVPGAHAGGYALVGMAAVLAATTHAPLMSAVLVFELSGDYAIVLPLMLTTTLATLVARRLRPDSIYTEELRRRGIPWEGSLAQRLARAVRARDILELDAPTVAAQAPLDDALAVLERGRTRVVYVVGDGAVRAIDLHVAKEVWRRRASGDATALGDVRRAGAFAREVPTATPDDSLPTLSEKLGGIDWGEIPVVDPAEPGRLVGIVTRRALLGAFDSELLQRDVLFTRVVWAEGQREQADYLELPRGDRVEVIAPPARFVGQVVDACEVRRRDRVTLLAVRREHAIEWVEPPDDAPVAAQDRWLVVGPSAAIDRLRGVTPG